MKKKNKFLPKIKEWVDANCPGDIVPYSADFEKKLVEEADKKNEEQKGEDGKDAKAPPVGSMLNRIIRLGYKALDLIYFFTAGPDEVRAWTVREGSKAP